MKQVIEIDDNGYFVRDVILQKWQETPANCIETPLPKDDEGNQLPFYKAKWTGTEWVEDMTQEEINELNNQPRELTEIEKLKISQAEQFETILLLLGGM